MKGAIQYTKNIPNFTKSALPIGGKEKVHEKELAVVVGGGWLPRMQWGGGRRGTARSLDDAVVR